MDTPSDFLQFGPGLQLNLMIYGRGIKFKYEMVGIVPGYSLLLSVSSRSPDCSLVETRNSRQADASLNRVQIFLIGTMLVT